MSKRISVSIVDPEAQSILVAYHETYGMDYADVVTNSLKGKLPPLPAKGGKR